MTIPNPDHAQGRKPQRYGPLVREIADFLVRSVESPNVHDLAERFPNASLRDFAGACALAAAMTSPTEGTA
jgi:hypothetical protein